MLGIISTIVFNPFNTLHSLLGWISTPLHEKARPGQHHHFAMSTNTDNWHGKNPLNLYEALVFETELIGYQYKRNIVKNQNVQRKIAVQFTGSASNGQT